jgi:phosphomannomutase
MTQELIISISGMRGLVGENLFPGTAAMYGAAFGSFLKRRHSQQKKLSVAIGRDSRPSGSMMFSAVASGLAAVGVDVIDLGICSTPAVGVMLRRLNCDGGIVITASHNPTPYNGIKLLLENGIAPPKKMADQIIEMYHQKKGVFVGALDCGSINITNEANQIHANEVVSIVDKEKIASKRFKVVLDSVNGAGGPEAILLLEALGCKVIGMNTEPTGVFAHTPEPTAENLTSLCQKVAECGADMGFAQDPDADRLAIVDETGRYIGEEFTLAFASRYVFSQMPGPAAANLSTSRMIDDIAAQAGCSVIRTPVGEANVANAMVANGCVIGGEGNGGIIDLRVGPIRDSLVGMALTLALLTDTGQTVSHLAAEVGGYTMHKSKYPADKQQAASIIQKAKTLLKNAAVNESDGCRFDLPEGWIHIRTSNTEPIMRVIIETRNSKTAQDYIDRIESICRGVLNS